MFGGCNSRASSQTMSSHSENASNHASKREAPNLCALQMLHWMPPQNDNHLISKPTEIVGNIFAMKNVPSKACAPCAGPMAMALCMCVCVLSLSAFLFS